MPARNYRRGAREDDPAAVKTLDSALKNYLQEMKRMLRMQRKGSPGRHTCSVFVPAAIFTRVVRPYLRHCGIEQQNGWSCKVAHFNTTSSDVFRRIFTFDNNPSIDYGALSSIDETPDNVLTYFAN